MNQLIRTAGIVALSLSSAIAQAQPCESLNDSTDNVIPAISGTPFSGSNARAYEITPQASVMVRSIRIITENTYSAKFMNLQLWDRDPATGFPGNLLGGGIFKINKNRGLQWQGTNLDRPVPLIQGTRYLVVWREPGGSQMPQDPTGTMVPMYRISGSNWKAAGTAAFKVRLYCSLLDSPNLLSVGLGCTNSLNKQGTMFANEDPWVGNADFALEGSGFNVSSPAVLFLGINPNFVSLPLPGFPAGCMLHTDVAVSVPGVTGQGGIGTASASGHVLFPLGMPNIAGLSGAVFRSQLAVVDLGLTGVLPVVTSNGMIVLIP